MPTAALPSPAHKWSCSVRSSLMLHGICEGRTLDAYQNSIRRCICRFLCMPSWTVRRGTLHKLSLDAADTSDRHDLCRTSFLHCRVPSKMAAVPESSAPPLSISGVLYRTSCKAVITEPCLPAASPLTQAANWHLANCFGTCSCLVQRHLGDIAACAVDKVAAAMLPCCVTRLFNLVADFAGQCRSVLPQS